MQLHSTIPCINCKHLDLENDNLTFVCTAFPGGIPDEILNGENPHTEPLEGQRNQIVFEPFDEVEKSGEIN